MDLACCMCVCVFWLFGGLLEPVEGRRGLFFEPHAARPFNQTNRGERWAGNMGRRSLCASEDSEG